eukprot:TRINITY_DN1222_c0_g1_i3.p1 TRINITY_DN1222_c0_g1~~TRINITY_DN1222_c0_g1_i3.p1  ORF type:complete len:292 (-),score=23.81 TRINITY_DN1222_c0_g1_i3:16-891(-)
MEETCNTILEDSFPFKYKPLAELPFNWLSSDIIAEEANSGVIKVFRIYNKSYPGHTAKDIFARDTKWVRSVDERLQYYDFMGSIEYSIQIGDIRNFPTTTHDAIGFLTIEQGGTSSLDEYLYRKAASKLPPNRTAIAIRKILNQLDEIFQVLAHHDIKLTRPLTPEDFSVDANAKIMVRDPFIFYFDETHELRRPEAINCDHATVLQDLLANMYCSLNAGHQFRKKIEQQRGHRTRSRFSLFSPKKRMITRLPAAESLFDNQQMFLQDQICLLYTSPSPRDGLLSRMPSSA